MIPPLVPVSQAPGGHIVPGHLANAPALDLRTSPALENEGPEGPQVCQQCGKQYSRACDLNKHLKTHIRPFKCPVEVCRYHMFGWPTEKELDRHYNDKHSKEPMVFSCLWQNCNYTSKRESNCKQHMEKTHGWNYVRSRPGNREEDALKQLETDLTLSHLETLPRSNLTIRTVPAFSLSPSPLEPCFPATHGSQTSESSSATVPYGTDVYAPWSSPMTRPSNKDVSQEEHTEAYAADPQVASCDDEWLKVPIDPRLYNTTPLQTPEKYFSPQAMPYSRDLLKISPTIATPKTSPIVHSQILTPLSEPSPGFRQQFYLEANIATPHDVETDPGRGASTSRGLRSGNTGRVAPPGKRSVRFSREPDDDSERDDERPRKRPRAPEGGDDEVGDPRMPCPFRVAHPEIYDANQDPRYYSCHTEHDNISTVVRHLGRPAHALDVDNARQSISSFNVVGNRHGHPEAGLCRKCWRAFTDPQAFELHDNTMCENVSRSKREKFEMILNTFCRTDSSQRTHLTDEDSEADESQGSGDSAEGVFARSDMAPGDEPVRRSEYLALVARLTALEREFSQNMIQNTPRIMPAQTGALVTSSLGTGIQPTQSLEHYSFDSGAGPSNSRPAGPAGNIVQGMGPCPAHYGNPAAFNQDQDRILSEFRPSTSRRSGSMSTARPTNHFTPHQADSQPGGDPGGPPDSSRGPSVYTGTPTNRTANVAAAAAAAAAAAGRSGGRGGVGVGGAGGGSSDGSQHVIQAQAAEYGQEGVSQESANAMSRDRWYQAIDASDALLDRVNFFDPPMDDINRYLDMDQQ